MPDFAGPLVQNAPAAPAVDLVTVPDLTARDNASNVASLRVGAIVRVVSDGNYYQLLTTAPTWANLGPTLVGGATSYTIVADQAARQALAPTVGDLVFQIDIQVTYQYRNDGLTTEWRVVILPSIADTISGFGGTAVYYYLDPAGDDANDGRDPARPKATFKSVFRDLNDAGSIDNTASAGGFSPFVEIRPLPGTYTETGFQDLSLSGSYPGGIYIIPRFSQFANNEAVTFSTDNGLIAGSVVEKDLTVSAFTSFARGERFIWVPDFSAETDVFPSLNNGMVVASTTPNLRILNPFTIFLTNFVLSQWECILECAGLNVKDDATSLIVYGMHVDNSTAQLIDYRNIRFEGCKVTNTGGSSVLFWESRSDISGIFSSYLDLPDQVNASGGVNGEIFQGFNSNDVDRGRFDWYSGRVGFGGNRFDDSPRFGSFTPSTGTMLSIQLTPNDWMDTDAVRINGYANVRMLSDQAFPNALGSLWSIDENARFTRQSGDIVVVNPALVGPQFSLNNMTQALGVSALTSVTNPAGNDVRLRPGGPSSSFANIAASPTGISDLNSLSRAT